MSGSDDKDVERAYRRYAANRRKQNSWSAANPGNLAIRAELTEAAFSLAGTRLTAAQTILDIGCGTGWWLERLAADDQVGATLYGLELLPDRRDAAAKRVPAATVELGDARVLPYDDASIDVVTLFTTLSSLPCAADVPTAIGEARRVLAPEGALLIWEPRIPNPLNRSTLFIDRASLRAALDGMRIETVTTTVFPPLARRLGRRTAELYPLLARARALNTHRLVYVSYAPEGQRP